MNDMEGENGHVPSRLLLWVITRFPIICFKTQNEKRRMKIIAAARVETSGFIAKKRVRTALRREIPLAIDRFSKVGENISVPSKKSKRIPLLIVAIVTGRSISIQLQGVTRKIFNAFQLRSYYPAVDVNVRIFQSYSDKTWPSEACLTEIIRRSVRSVWTFDDARLRQLNVLI